jgi:hypothetical protein
MKGDLKERLGSDGKVANYKTQISPCLKMTK